MHLTDERLCWLAIQDQLQKRASKLGPLGWLSAFAGAGNTRSRGASRLGGDLRRDKRSNKLGDYAIAVDEAAQRLTTDERRHLRQTGEVPPWFLADVEQRAKEIRKQQ